MTRIDLLAVQQAADELKTQHRIEVTTVVVGGVLAVRVVASPLPGPATWLAVWNAFYPVAGPHRVDQEQR